MITQKVPRTYLELFLASLVLLASFVPASAAETSLLWALLKKPGHIAFVRHALAPGTGDPDNFDLNECNTQRILSDAGRRQAARTGDAFRAKRISQPTVYSSQWCRCMETAELIKLGTVTPLPSLNSLYRFPEREARQIETLRADIKSLNLDKPVVMVSHQFTIRGLLKTSTRSGEIAVVRRRADGSLVLLGKIAPRSTQ